MQRFVDGVLAVTKESVKTLTYESLNNIVRLINGISSILLSILPGKATILEGLHGWELRPTFRGPRLPRWMGNGVSSFNQFIHELSMDSDASSIEYSSGEEDSDADMSPASPLSQSSRVSLGSSITKYDKHWAHWIGYTVSWILFPLKVLLGMPLHLYHLLCARETRSSSFHGPLHINSPRRLQTLKDHVVHRATDRRRGIIEDLHLGIEISIEAIFDAFHRVAHFLLSPSEAFRTVLGWAFHRRSGAFVQTFASVESVPTATLGESDPTPTERKNAYNSLNTDARTCQDVITELGYPYEAIRVVTADGYILLLERIPRRDSRKAVYLQHGVLDSSMGWVSNGVVGSPAFAAFDQGYDVFLGNFRGLVSREHVDRNISSKQYWMYSINEHATADIPAMIEKIHEVKTCELNLHQHDPDEENEEQPYKLCAICHSLGGAAILMYLVTRRMQEKPHRLSRLILLSPAGFHDDSTFVFTIVEYLFLSLAPIMSRIVPAFYIPTWFFRMLLNKLARDFHNYPAVGGLVQMLMGYVVGGDSSNWVGVMGLPHYNMNDMPGVSFFVALHLAQMKHTRKFRMFDYGSTSANMQVYGSPEPVDIGEHYGLIDIPVDLVAGRKDKVIRLSMVRKHYNTMKEAGVEVSFNVFEYAHLDFTFSHREELMAYVMSQLQLVKPANQQLDHKVIKSKKKDGHANGEK
ncbi:hypothetical protein Nepgr_002907 [Nepenthes gracilis]|uniref:Partial AB-hydrolase lipase domain-containing protein n=1 Tax=Nepenthes gracilis TaxID=150966 RepID=A0AAD3RYJ1_NEPGR|nr:hypothetical protein Nepgr_002907 [Nepenthes gracilis]